MKPSGAVLGLVGLATAISAASSDPPRFLAVRRDLETNDYYVLQLKAETPPAQVALQLGLVYEGQLGELAGHHVFSGSKAGHDIVKRGLDQRRKGNTHETGGSETGVRNALDGVLFSQKQALRKPWEKRIIPPSPSESLTPVHARETAVPEAVAAQSEVARQLGIQDPIFHEQWHLFNTVQVGHDVNVTGLWKEGVTGKNTTVAIVDDGLDMYSDDLRDNYYAKGSYDFNEKTTEPRPRLSDDKHGTRCAGEVSAVKNNVCGVGVAYDSKIAGLRILSKAISDADEAVAMNYDFQNNLIYSCSWGPPDDGRSMDAPGILIRRAMLNGVQNGRNGLGSIYVFASGNGAASEDNCNFDGYTNSIYSITVGAIDRFGRHPYYSEKCSASLVVTYSSGSGDAIHTTDVGQNACYNGHGGTSAAAPLAAGIFALALQLRPDLTWRDMQYLVMMTAVPVNVENNPDEWQETYIGKKYSHTFAYGKVDSYALVEAAKTWTNVKPQAWYYSPWIHVHQAIPQGDVGLTVTIEITEDMLKEANFARIEHVTVTMNIEHTRRGDISVDLVSPNNVVSHLSATRKPDNTVAGYVDWTFMSVVHWGEPGVGKWTLIVKDTVVNDHNGTFTDFHLKLWGESIDAGKARLLPMPNENDDENHDSVSTTTLPASTTTLVSGVPVTDQPDTLTATPTDHPDRPVKPTMKPSSPSQEQGSPARPTGGSSAVPGSETENETVPSTTSASWLPAFLANMSTKTQIWIYGALGLIVAFCLGLGIYLYLARRKRLRNNSRDNYEFELLDEEEAEGLNDSDGEGGHNEKGPLGVTAGRKGRRKATRGRELYDAFADGSDDEDRERNNDGEGSDFINDEAQRSLSFEENDEGENTNSYGSHRVQAYRDGSDEHLQRGGSRGGGGDSAGSAQRSSDEVEPEHYVVGDDSDEPSDEEIRDRDRRRG
ncbi:pheromone processing endoprotease kex2 [Niveomyces insectorum RCEF 264]|uniref:Pheromone processing endoprotease kex2 n=1 Tax=Niveomyces insectorum RCEF 264 TaxID=1081102 RepID=A0A167WGC4_9HYPO|nr:pheromone processing endoprotease kex2 [Niveomyces insectorum RCEF 264]